MSSVREMRRRLPSQARDGLLAATLLSADLVVVTSQAPQRTEGSSVIAILILLAASVPVVWRRRYPLAVLAISFSALLGHEALGYPEAPLLGAFVALYSVGAYVERRASKVAASVAITAYMALRVLNILRYGDSLVELLPNVAVVVMIWIVGANVQTIRSYAASLEDKALRLEREREERARRAVADERARIARELHDVVAHSVGVMVVQAGGARRILDSRPRDAREALRSIERTGRQALTEMRRLLGILRKDEEAGPLEPQPGLDQVDDLLTQMRAAGVPVSLVIEGRPRPLPPGIDLSAYRIIQEAMTNTLRHAGPARARVMLRYRDDSFDIEVLDDGEATATDRGEGGPGQGLIGMRERATLLGGEFRAGARPGGGYGVSIRLPLERNGT